jgi:hypothetical protein
MDALAALDNLIVEDVRFEYMEASAVTDATMSFVRRATLDQATDFVDAFVTEHAREPADHVCYFPVEHLSVAAPADILGVRFLPPDDVELPPMGPWPDPQPTMASVIAVDCHGTGFEAMRARARAVAEHALRVLRVAVDHQLVVRQLLFRLGETSWFDVGASRWEASADRWWEAELAGLVEITTQQAISTLGSTPLNDLEARAHIALEWIERAQLTTDATVKLLFLFFALEAILGRKDEELKGADLALRRATLGAVTVEHFHHPFETYLLYDQVRSAAVHGSRPRKITDREITWFMFDVRSALNEYLDYARAESFTKRSQILKALDAHGARSRLREWFRRENPDFWDQHFSGL